MLSNEQITKLLCEHQSAHHFARAIESAARAEALDDAAKACDDAGFKDLAHDIRRLKDENK